MTPRSLAVAGFVASEAAISAGSLLRCEIGHSRLDAEKRKLGHHRHMSTQAPVAESFKTPACTLGRASCQPINAA